LPEVATESVNRVARWLSQKYRTLTVSMLVAQNVELFTLALSGITIILIPDKSPKYRTVRINTGHLATLNMKYINRPPLLDDLDPPLRSVIIQTICRKPFAEKIYFANVSWRNFPPRKYQAVDLAL